MKAKIYTKTDCPYCTMAKQYLREHGIEYTEIVFDDGAERQNMYDDFGLEGWERTVPQVFVIGPEGEKRIGGYHDLLQSEIGVGDFNQDF